MEDGSTARARMGQGAAATHIFCSFRWTCVSAEVRCCAHQQLSASCVCSIHWLCACVVCTPEGSAAKERLLLGTQP